MTTMTCSFHGCGRTTRAKGLCNGHYVQRQKGKELAPLRTRMGTGGTCSVAECTRDVFAKGQCQPHYQQQHRGAPVSVVGARELVRPRGLAAITDAVANRDRSTCWTDWADLPCWSDMGRWGGAFMQGYPILGTDKVMWLAMAADGRPRPAAPTNRGLHSCDTPACWNPAHLRWGTQRQNIQDMQDQRNYCAQYDHCNPLPADPDQLALW